MTMHAASKTHVFTDLSTGVDMIAVATERALATVAVQSSRSFLTVLTHALWVVPRLAEKERGCGAAGEMTDESAVQVETNILGHVIGNQ